MDDQLTTAEGLPRYWFYLQIGHIIITHGYLIVDFETVSICLINNFSCYLHAFNVCWSILSDTSWSILMERFGDQRRQWAKKSCSFTTSKYTTTMTTTCWMASRSFQHWHTITVSIQHYIWLFHKLIELRISFYPMQKSSLRYCKVLCCKLWNSQTVNLNRVIAHNMVHGITYFHLLAVGTRVDCCDVRKITIANCFVIDLYIL